MTKPLSVLLGLAALILVGLSLSSGEAGFDLSSSTGLFVLTEIRLPRVLTALAVAMGLAASTALLQLALRSQIAEPALFGLTGFAGLGSLIALSLGLGFGSIGSWPLAVFASLLGILPIALIAQRAEGFNNRDSSRLRTNLPIIGVSLGAMAVAMVGLASAASPDPRLRSVALWAFGSLSLQTLSGAITALILTVVLMTLTLMLSPTMQKLALGPGILRGLRVSTGPVFLLAFSLTAAFAATSAFGTGSIAFVGLLSVTLGRMLYGSKLRQLILGSSLIALVVVLACDLLARSLAAPIELPIGLFTALVGAPVLIWSMTRRSRA